MLLITQLWVIYQSTYLIRGYQDPGLFDTLKQRVSLGASDHRAHFPRVWVPDGLLVDVRRSYRELPQRRQLGFE